MKPPTAYRAVLISDCTINPLADLLKDLATPPMIQCQIAPLDQMRQTVQDANMPIWQDKPNLAVIWTLPEKQIPAFARLVYYNELDKDALLQQVVEYSWYLEMAATRAEAVLVPLWSMPRYFRGKGVIDWRNGIGIANTLARMNLQLSDLLEKQGNIYLLNTMQWAGSVTQAEDDRMWYLGKIPYSRSMYHMAAMEIKSATRAIYGAARKLLVLDLDNTLWGGIVGEVGWANVQLGGLDPVGEAFVEFQKYLLALKNRGVLLAIASKNDEQKALEAIQKHPAMILRPKDFVAWKINWHDKAQNIADMVDELNLRLMSVVFIDDDPTQRARVREALPDVYVPEWPESPIQYKKALLELNCFDMVSFSEEDKARTQFYLDEAQRKAERSTVPSLEEWLESLQLQITCEEVNLVNLTRANQLLNKVNQFNLITRRMEKGTLDQYAKQENTTVLVFSVSDRIGDYGLVGLCSFELRQDDVAIMDFLLSCRALGRGLEETMLGIIARYCIENKRAVITARYIPTANNKLCATFLPDHRFEPVAEQYRHTNPEKLAIPTYIHLVNQWKRKRTTKILRMQRPVSSEGLPPSTEVKP